MTLGKLGRFDMKLPTYWISNDELSFSSLLPTLSRTWRLTNEGEISTVLQTCRVHLCVSISHILSVWDKSLVQFQRQREYAMTDTNSGLPPDVNPENNPRPDTPLITNNNNNNNNNIFSNNNNTNNNNNNNANRSRNNQNSLISVRDRLFHALFFKIALAYSQTVPG